MRFKRSKRFPIAIFLILVLLLLAPFVLTSCGGGGGGTGGGGGNGGSTPDNSPPVSTNPSTSNDEPNPSQTPEPANKGALIVISMPDRSAYAVIAGPCDYPGEENDLTYTAGDALDFKDTLLNSGSWNGAQVIVQNNVHVTKSMIQQAVANGKNNLADGGLFVFFYSGHGTNTGGNGYIIPYDGGISSSNMISQYELRSWINDLPMAAKKYVLIDSCFSGLFIGKSVYSPNTYMKAKYMPVNGSGSAYKSEDFSKSLVGLPNTYVMTSSKGSELSWESGYLQNGVFVYYLCEGLSSGSAIGPADSNSNGTITAEELSQYVPGRTNNYVVNGTYWQYTQQPQTYDNVSGDLPVKSSSGGGNPNPDPTPTPTPAQSPAPDPNVAAGGDVLITISMPDRSAYAVIVGMADYPGTEHDLTCTDDDAIDFKNSLSGSSFWSGADIKVQNIQVTKAVIQQAVENAKNNINSDGLFVFLYSGHGSNSGGTGYLIPYDGAENSAMMISDSELKNWINAFAPTTKKAIFIDSCFSGLFINKNFQFYSTNYMKAKYMPIKGSDNNYFAENFPKTLVGLSNTYVMTSSKGSEVSWESNYLQNGVFVYYLCEGMGSSGAAFGPADTNGNSAITSEELGWYVPSRTSSYVVNNSSGYNQQPQIYDNYSGELRIK